MFDLSFEKLLVIGVIALFLIGPQRLPHYAAQLGRWVRVLRSMTDGAKERIRDELGEDVDWEQLDPRRYDPRRIIREALLDDPLPAPAPVSEPLFEESTLPEDSVPATSPARAAFDDEAT
jgi:Sec-independent protein translocase protein TatA